MSATVLDMPPPKPARPTIYHNSIPLRLIGENRWVVWGYRYVEDKCTKKPFDANVALATRELRGASSQDPETWASYEDARRALELFDGKLDGLGWAPLGSGLLVLDFDDCLVAGRPLAEAADYINAVDSYAEISPSRRGVRVIVEATAPEGRKSTNRAPWADNASEAHFAISDGNFYATITGNVLDGRGEIRADQAGVDYLHGKVFPPKPRPMSRNGNRPSSYRPADGEVLERAFASKNGTKIRALYAGDLCGYPSRSEAAGGLAYYLAFWVPEDDEDQLVRLLVGSANERLQDEGYAAGEAADAMRNVANHYEWREPTGSSDKVEEGARPPVELPALAQEPQILERFDEMMLAQGLVGERATARVAYLTHVSRLLPKPVRQVTKGDSSTGKSYAAECALNLAAPEYVYIRTDASAKALFFTKRDLRHCTLVFYEANKLSDPDDELTRVVRTLLSEGVLRYEITDVKNFTTREFEKEGPVAFISTVAKAKLDPEVETRVLSIYSDGSDEQTAAVVESLCEDAADPKSTPDVSEWHRLDRWLASFEHKDVVVPWGPALGSFKLSGPPRLRRDITNLFGLAKAHALLHRAHRETDKHCRVIANLDDYEVAHELIARAMAIASDRAVRAATREIVAAVAALRNDGKSHVSIRAAARRAGKAVSTTSTDVHDALELGYLVNLSQVPNRYDLAIGDPLPAEEHLLPTVEELRSARSVRVRSVFGRPTEHENPMSTGDSGSCSACSIDSGEKGCSDENAPTTLDEWGIEHPELLDEQAS